MLGDLSEVVNWPEFEASYSPSPDDGLMCVALCVTLEDLCYTHSQVKFAACKQVAIASLFSQRI